MRINTEWYLNLAGKYALAAYKRGEQTIEEWESNLVSVPEKDLYQMADGLQSACEEIRELREQIKQLQDDLKHSDTPEAMTHALELHHRCVVRPVVEYCEAFYDWIKALEVAHKEWEEKSEDSKQWHSPPPLYSSKEHIGFVLMAIGKSDYLRRRIYAKESHRTEKCPVHKGKWSGLRWPTEPPMEGCLCQDPDGNVSGWIPVKDE